MKTTILASLLAGMAGASFAAAPTANLNYDVQTYQNLTQKAAADYKSAVARCDTLAANAKSVCMQEANAARAHADADAVARYKHSTASTTRAEVAAADADYALAKAKCADMNGADKDACLATARTSHATALADAKAGRHTVATTAVAATGAGAVPDGQPNGLTSDKAAAIERCKDATGSNNTACLLDNGKHPDATAAREKMANAADRTADAAANATDRAAANTHDVAANAADATAVAAQHTHAAAHDVAADSKVAAHDAARTTREVAHEVAQDTRAAAHNVAAKTREVAHDVAAKTRSATANTAEESREASHDVATTTDHAAAKTGTAVADSVITTKVKADFVKEPNLSALAIHVDTQKGVVMLSGFVNSKSEAERAVEVAKSVEGVTKVKSALKVK